MPVGCVWGHGGINTSTGGEYSEVCLRLLSTVTCIWRGGRVPEEKEECKKGRVTEGWMGYVKAWLLC